IQEDHKREVERLLTKLSETEARLDSLQREQASSSSPGSRSPPHPLNLTRDKRLEERQSGEGMDQNELEVIDAQSQSGSLPSSPTLPTAATVLEKVLSPTMSTSYECE
ncbi:hypothetical protein AC249_AIPGENE6042, partial [Exaiptasia diaphana]